MISLLYRDVEVPSGEFGQGADARGAGFVVGAASAHPITSIYTMDGYLSNTPMGYVTACVSLFKFAQFPPRPIMRAPRHGERHDGDSEFVYERLMAG